MRWIDYAFWRQSSQAVVLLVTISITTGCSWLTWTNSSIRGGDRTPSSQEAPGDRDAVLVSLVEKDRTAKKKDNAEKDEVELSFAFEKPVEADIGEGCSGNRDCSHEKITYESKFCTQPGSCSADLFIVEFNDQGLVYHPQQMAHLLEFLQSTMSPHTCHPGEQEPCFDDVNLIVATHGWRHNADFEDWNLRQLRETLYSAVLFEGLKSGKFERWNPSNRPRKVVGVYLGWRGALIKEYPNSPRIPFTDSWTLSDVALGLPAVLSFWDRKETALNVALGSIRELFTSLGHIRAAVNDVYSFNGKAEMMGRERKWNERCVARARHTDGRCIAMKTLISGHSFGALAIYNAISESLMNSVSRGALRDTVSSPFAARGDEVSSPYADLIVLINPAFEGARFEPLYQASLNRMKRNPYSPYQNPVLVLVTGTSDYATRYAFPLGRFFNTLFQSSSQKSKDGAEIAGRADQEINANRNTVGHIPRYMTHYLDSFLTIPTIEPKKDADSSLDLCLKTGWEKLTSKGGSGEKSLAEAIDEAAIVGKEKLWASIKTKQGWSARAFCGGFRLSPAMYEATEGKDPLKDLPDQSSDQDPWANQLLSKDISSDKWGSGPRNPHNPIWVVRTKDTHIINGHNGFITPSMVGLLQQLYREALQ